jgi:serine phosphatase RsbU (regulator of sigma subunit)
MMNKRKPAETLDAGGDFRRRYIGMNLNALAGYLLVEFFAVIAKYYGLTTISYTEIFILASIVNGGTLFFIAVIYFRSDLYEKHEKLFFLSEYILFIIMFFIAAYYLREMRNLALIFGLIAMSVELPFLFPWQAFMISAGTLIAHLAVSFFAILIAGQDGSLTESLVYNIAFIPPMMFFVYVVKQLHVSRAELEKEASRFKRLSRDLAGKNRLLEEYRYNTEAEIELAGMIQKSIYPPAAPAVRDWECAVEFTPLMKVSGDLYDFYVQENRLKGAVIFDVSGHGISSSLITMIVKPVFSRLFYEMESAPLHRIVEKAKNIIEDEISSTGNFVTGVLMRFSSDMVEFVNMGHPDPLMKKRSTGELLTLSPRSDDQRCMPIGLRVKNKRYRVISRPVERGDLILLYTDGIVYSSDRQGEKFGEVRILNALLRLKNTDPETAIAEIHNSFIGFLDSSPPGDDILLMAFRKK